MTITFYSYTGEPNVVNKTPYLKLSKISYSNVYFKEENSILNPILELQFDTSTFATTLSKCNYVLIYDINRYYFITEFVSVSENIWRLHLEIDVLMTYKDTIYEQTGIIGRQEHLYNANLFDNLMPTTDKTVIETSKMFDFWKFGDDYSQYYTYIVGMIGKPYSTNLTFGGGVGGMGVNMYAVQYSQISKVINKTFDYEIWAQLKNFFINYGEFISFITKLPFNPSSVGGVETVSVNNMNIGDQTVNAQADIYYGLETDEDDHILKDMGIEYLYPNSRCNVVFQIGEIPRKFNDFRDFSPYMQIEFYLPYLGWKTVDPDVLYGKRLNVVYFVDLCSANFTCVITDLILTDYADIHFKNPSDALKMTPEHVLYEFSGTMNTSLRFAYGNGSEIAQQRFSNVIGTTKQLVNTATNFAGGMVNSSLTAQSGAGGTLSAMTGAAGAVVGGVGSLVNTAIDFGSNAVLARKPKGSSGGSAGDFSEASIQFKVCYRKMYTETAYTPSFDKFYGRPLNAVRRLDGIYGFTTVDYIHPEGFSCTTTELDMIVRMLKSGVIL